MPAAIPVVAYWAAVAYEVGTLWTIVIVAAASVAAGYLQQAMQKSPEELAFDTSATGGLRFNTRSTQELVRIVYGEQRVGGNDAFIETVGEDLKDLWVVQCLSEGECEGIAQIDSVDQIFLSDKLTGEYGGNASYWFHSGSSTQTYDTNLNSAISKWIDNQRYVCYIVWKLTYDRDYFQGIPNRTVVLKGKKVYDFRDTTWKYSNNPVLCLYDYMVNSRYGTGIDSTKIDVSSWTSAANYCDTKGWTLNYTVFKNQSAQDVMDAICVHFRGQMVWYDGKFYLRYADLNYESSVMTLDDEHIFRDVDGKANILITEPSEFNKPDGIRVTFTDPDKDYVNDDIMIGEDVGVVESLTLVGCTNRQQAADLGVYALERLQLNRTISGLFRGDAVKLEPHDVITMNTSALNISDQLMRVQVANILGNDEIELMLIYEDIVLYNDDYDLDTEGTYTCNLPDITAEPPSVGNVQISEATYNYRLRTFTRLEITFDLPSNYPWFRHVEVRLSYDDVNWEHLFNAISDFEINPVEEGVTYWIRLKVVSIWGTRQQDSNDYKVSRAVLGYTSDPTSLGSLEAIVNQNTINLYSAKVSDPDIELYEFRVGSSWSGAILLAALRSPNLSLSGVKPGNHTFWANTLANSGNYGLTPRSASAVLKDPPDGWTLQATETCDYNGVGTHDNTEYVVYDGGDYLKCSHTGGVLVGTYTSPIYDRGASGRYMVFCLVDIVVIGTGTTWDDQIPSPNIWSSIGIDVKSWAEIFTLVAGPSVSMKLKYGETSPPTSEVVKMEILSAIVTGRYFQMEITITDPSAEINALVEEFSLKFCQ